MGVKASLLCLVVFLFS